MSTSADDSAVMACVDGSPASDAAVERARARRVRARAGRRRPAAIDVARRSS